jgi:hypothetical protein
MNRGLRAARQSFLLLLAAAFLFASAGEALAQSARRDRTLESQLRAHIQVLASDEFEGREPGTEGERKTLRYLARQWFDIGLVSGTNLPGNDWFQPVTVVGREPAASAAQFTRRGRRILLPAGTMVMLTSGQRSLVRDAPVLFVGRGDGPLPGRSQLAGRVALLLEGGTEGAERQNAYLASGAAAVLTVLDGERTLDDVMARRQRASYALASQAVGGDLEGFVTAEGLTRLLTGSGQTLDRLKAEAARPSFVPRLMDLTATLEATTRETTIRTHNLIARLPGRRPDAGAVLFVAHWDHFGICAEPPAEDLVCNGAVDNASGLAVLTEIARRLARGPQLDRDVYFLATTAEELGLLGAHAFAENPPLPLSQIVAAFNIDSIALAPAGSSVAIVGRGMTSLDGAIGRVVRQQRGLVDGDAANAYVRRQDGWALLQHDVPAVMVSSAYADLKRIEDFFEGDYHRPSDDLNRPIELGGAADDVLLHVALARWFGDARNLVAKAK